MADNQTTKAKETEPGTGAGVPENLETAALDQLNGLAAEDAANEYQPGAPGDGQKTDKKAVGGVGAKELAALYQMGFAVVGARWGGHWALSSEEAAELGAATDAVLEKYGAKMQMGPEVTLVITGVMVTAPRLVTTMMAGGKKPEETDGKTEQGGEGKSNGD